MCRTKGAVLIGRRDGAYYFVDSVFDHGDGFQGATGFIVYPVTQEMADEAMSPDMMAERYEDVWREINGSRIQEDCETCEGDLDRAMEEGCDECGIQSLSAWCGDMANYEGYECMFDCSYCCDAEPILREIGVELELTDCIGGGRIFGGDDREEFDEIYNQAAYDAVLAIERKQLGRAEAAALIFGRA